MSKSAAERTVPLLKPTALVWRVRCDGSAVHFVPVDSERNAPALCGTTPEDSRKGKPDVWRRTKGIEPTCQHCMIEASKAWMRVAP